MSFKLSIFSLLAFTILVIACNKDDDDNDQPLSHDMSCIPSSLHRSVIAFYPFTQGSLDDFSAIANDLNNPTAAKPAPDRNNNPICAYEFQNNATEEYLTSTNTSFLNNLKEFSVTLWYMPINNSRDGGVYEGLILRDRNRSLRNADRSGQWSLGLYDCRRAVFGRHSSVWDSLIIPLDTGFSCYDEIVARTDKWHFATIVYNGTTETMEIYRNSILQDSSVGNTSTNTVEDIGDLFIGLKYTGVIDDIIIFNKALSAAEVNQLYQMQPCCSEIIQ